MTRFRTFVISLALASSAIVAQAQEKTANGWTKLFNGRDLTGWKTFLPANSTTAPEQVWSVKDASIICQGKPNGYIYTDREYGNYELRLQWRWGAAPVKGRNSGVLLHTSGPDKLWPKSAEAQLASGSAGDFWLIDEFKLQIDPARQDTKTPRHYFRHKLDDVEKPIGEWNQYEISCTSDTVRLMVNGKLVNEGKGPELTRGKICLQSEGAEIHFRNIEIKTVD